MIMLSHCGWKSPKKSHFTTLQFWRENQIPNWVFVKYGIWQKWDFFGDFDPLCIFFFFARFPEIGTSMNTLLVLMVNHFHHIRHICARNHWWKYHQFKTENSTFHRFEKSHKKSYLKSLIDHCKQSELRLHFDWPKIIQFGEFWKT